MATKQKTEAELTRDHVLAALDRLGGLSVQEDTLIFEGERFVLPASLEGNVDGAIDYLVEYRNGQEETYAFTREYPYRPADGAAAFDRAMRSVFGTSGIGKTQFSMFGSRPPELRTIAVGLGETAQVPWGQIKFSPLDATFYTGATGSEHGVIFEITVQAPRKHQRRIAGFLDVIERELATGSIYRGKAINGASEPAFVDVWNVDPSTVVYSADVMTQLNANLWTLLDHTELMRKLGTSLKRAVLIEGPYGTGKTLAGALTGQRAVANGWTYVVCRPGHDDLMTTLQTAKLYAPAVVWFEDIDTVGAVDGGNSMYLSRLLDALDGITAKGAEVIAGFTTNHVERLQKGLLRPGRIDTVIHVGELDAAGVQRLVEVVVPSELLGDIDYALVARAFEGYVPAFAREAIDRALRYSMARNGGWPDDVTTDDLVNAATGLRAQHRLMQDASESTAPVTIDGILTSRLEEVLARVELPDHGNLLEVTEPDVATVGHNN